jgi:hypothetical protein
MKYQNIAQIFEMIEKADARFIASVQKLTEAQENYRPVPHRWTIAENVEHISIVNNGFFRLTNKLLKQAEADPKPAKADLQLASLTMTDEGQLKEGKWVAPEIVRPTGSVRVADALASSRKSISDLFILKSRLEAVDLSDQLWNHPMAGPLNLYQWLLLYGEHEERHRLQIEEIKSSIGYPGEEEEKDEG